MSTLSKGIYLYYAFKYVSMGSLLSIFSNIYNRSDIILDSPERKVVPQYCGGNVHKILSSICPLDGTIQSMFY